MYRYFCFGLNIASEVEMPEFRSAGSATPSDSADVEIRLRAIERQHPPVGPQDVRVSVAPEVTHFFWEEAGDYLVEGGTSISIDPVSDAEPDLYRLPLLGIVFAALLAQRGLQVLHASAVSIGGVAVGLVGDKGMGKSTTAAALHHAGHGAISDDVLALNQNSAGDFEMVPGFPHLKLWPRSIEQMGGDPDRLAPLHDRVTKRGYHLGGAFPSAPLPLASLYLLDWGNETAVHDLGLLEAFSSIVPHTFLRRYGPDTPQTSSSLLRSCSDLVNRVPVKRLVRKPDLTLLHEIVKVLEADVSASTRGRLAPEARGTSQALAGRPANSAT
jgi:hypothetical protein